jgi:uncharacterized protein DUF6578
MTVWVDSWQMQCCGEPFQVGSQIAWTLRSADSGFLHGLLGPHAQPAADAAEDHHGGVPEGTVPTSGTVTGIAAVHCRFATAPGDQRTLYPVPGSGSLTVVRSADGRTADRDDEKLMGYLVELVLS